MFTLKCINIFSIFLFVHSVCSIVIIPIENWNELMNKKQSTEHGTQPTQLASELLSKYQDPTKLFAELNKEPLYKTERPLKEPETYKSERDRTLDYYNQYQVQSNPEYLKTQNYNRNTEDLFAELKKDDVSPFRVHSTYEPISPSKVPVDYADKSSNSNFENAYNDRNEPLQTAQSWHRADIEDPKAKTLDVWKFRSSLRSEGLHSEGGCLAKLDQSSKLNDVANAAGNFADNEAKPAVFSPDPNRLFAILDKDLDSKDHKQVNQQNEENEDINIDDHSYLNKMNAIKTFKRPESSKNSQFQFDKSHNEHERADEKLVTSPKANEDQSESESMNDSDNSNVPQTENRNKENIVDEHKSIHGDEHQLNDSPNKPHQSESPVQESKSQLVKEMSAKNPRYNPNPESISKLLQVYSLLSDTNLKTKLRRFPVNKAALSFNEKENPSIVAKESYQGDLESKEHNATAELSAHQTQSADSQAAKKLLVNYEDRLKYMENLLKMITNYKNNVTAMLNGATNLENELKEAINLAKTFEKKANQNLNVETIQKSTNHINKKASIAKTSTRNFDERVGENRIQLMTPQHTRLMSPHHSRLTSPQHSRLMSFQFAKTDAHRFKGVNTHIQENSRLCATEDNALRTSGKLRDKEKINAEDVPRYLRKDFQNQRKEHFDEPETLRKPSHLRNRKYTKALESLRNFNRRKFNSGQLKSHASSAFDDYDDIYDEKIPYSSYN